MGCWRAPSHCSLFCSEMKTSVGSELEDSEQERTDSDSDPGLGSQPRGRFSRQPVKYLRTQAQVAPVIPKASRLPLRASTEANVATGWAAESSLPRSSSVTREESTRSRKSSTDPSILKHRSGGRQQLKHFEITQETARIVSKLQVSGASASPEGAGSAAKGEDLIPGTYL